jgi:hypothetical protein
MVLLVVVGLAATLATLAIALIVNMRSDTRESSAILHQAQSRIMLSAALAYLQESSRVGWDGVGGVGSGTTGETFGWTDARDGALGPRGARPPAGGNPVDANGCNLDPAPAATVPSWWTRLYGPAGSMGITRAYRPYLSSADEADPAIFPAPALRRWPLPGSAVRCDMPVWQRPPYAIKPIYAPNPFRPPVAYGDPAWTATWKSQTGMNVNWLRDTFDANQGALGMLDPQPVAEEWPAFAVGDGELRPATRGAAWFRIYRELLSDHDNNRSNDVDYDILGGVASAIQARSYDTVALYDPADATSSPPLRNYSVFVIACGAGGSRGFRWWSLSRIDPRRALEPMTAEESKLFPNEAVFNLARQGEVVRWFRVEHSARVQPGMGEQSKRIAYEGNDPENGGTDWSFPWLNWGTAGWYRDAPAASNAGDAYRVLAVPSALGAMGGWAADNEPFLPQARGGSITWLQRLDSEPIKW